MLRESRFRIYKISFLFMVIMIAGSITAFQKVSGLPAKRSTDTGVLDFSTNLLASGDPYEPNQEFAFPPTGEVKFDNISVDQGLSQSSVLAIIQDQYGLMWFGTQDGLNKYDGYEFTIFKHDPEDTNSLSNNTILSIYEDDAGIMWIGTVAGLDRYKRELARWDHYPLDSVLTIRQDGSGVLWIGSYAGLFRYNGGEAEGLIRVASDRTYAILEDKEGFLWVGTDRGLAKYDQERKKIAHYQHRSKDESSLGNDFIRVLFEDSNGEIWIGTDGGIDKIEPVSETFTHFKHDDNERYSLSSDTIRAIYEDRTGVIWVGTDDGGLNRLDPGSRGFIHYRYDADNPSSLSSDLVRSIYQDQGGILWVGTQTGGIDKLDFTQKNFLSYEYEGSEKSTLSNNHVTSFVEDYSQILWVGTGGGGVNRVDRRMGLFNQFNHDPDDAGSLSEDYVTSLYVDRSGVLWVGTLNGGLNAYDRFSGKFEHFLNDPKDEQTLAKNTISAILEDSQGVLWIGMLGGGLDTFQRIEKEFSHYYDLTSKLVTCLYEDQNGDIWVGTSDAGINKLNRQRSTFDKYVHDPYNPQSLSADNVQVIYQAQNGVYWIGTAGGGLNKFSPETGIFTHYREKDGLPNEVVYGILEDEQGMLWLSTNNGLSKFDPETEVFRNYDVLDGLQSNEFNSNAFYKNQRGEMFFGGVRGFNVFSPQEIRDDPYQPPIVLTSLTQSGGDVTKSGAVEGIDELTFYWPNNFFEFEFAALSFSQSEKNQYAYMLDGFRDETWNYIGTKRFGRYTNLPSGAYTLLLKGSNKDGVWNLLGKTVKITIVPPFWMTWWFQALAVFIVVGGLFTGYGLRVRNMRIRTNELENQVASRTRELEALNTIAAVVGSSLDLDKILDDALEKILEVLQVEAGGIYLVQAGGQSLVIEAFQGLSEEFVSQIDNLRIGEGFSGKVVQTGEVMIIPDVSADSRLTRSIVRDEGFHSLVVLPILSRGITLGSMFLMTRDFRDYSGKDIELLVAICGQIGSAIENAKFFKEEHHRSEQFRVLAEVGRKVSMVLDVDQVLEEVVRLVRSTFGYYHVAIGLIEGDYVVYRVGSGELWDDPEFRFKPAHLRIGSEGLSGWVAATGTPLVVPDVSQESRYIWMHGSQTRSETTVPIIVKGRVIGILDVQSEKLDAFDETDLSVLQSLAHQAGAAIENARLYEQAQQAAVLEERARLARELHDAVTQTLFSASLLAEALPITWENDRQEGEKLLVELKQLNRGALAEMRTLLIELRPSALIEAKFKDLLQQLAEAASGREGLPVEVKVECNCELPPDVHIALYRIAQEALNNVVKHSRAGQAAVMVSCSRCTDGKSPDAVPKEIILEVSDNGRGFVEDQVQPDHLGLEIMRERARDIGATLDITSGAGIGTRITVKWQDHNDNAR